MKDFKEFSKICATKAFFDGDHGIDSTKMSQLYLTSSDKHLGTILYARNGLRDGGIVVYVDDCGHTKVMTANETGMCISERSEDHIEYMKVYKEMQERGFGGEIVEIIKLRKQIALQKEVEAL